MTIGTPHRGFSKFFRLAFGSAAMVGASFALSGTGHAQTFNSAEHSYTVTTVADGLENPWGLAFLPGGDMLVTERPGRLRLVHADGRVEPNPVGGVPEVHARGQGGLLDVVLHPNFAQNRLVYLSYAKPLASGATTAVVRGRFDGTNLTGVEEIYEARAQAETNAHFGSRLVFQGDYLFVTVGDRGARPQLGTGADHPAQDPSNNQGTVNRMYDDGRIPSDNPLLDRAGARPEVWSYGHRNLQGLALRPGTDQLWNSEHGPQGGDELNQVRPGRNYGWPIIGYGVQYGGSQIHASTEGEGLEQPVHYWVPSIATSGLAFYTGDAFPNWRGNAFIGGLAGQHLARVVLNGDEAVDSEILLGDLGERIRDVRDGPDGYLYVLTDSEDGKILRLEPSR